MAFFQMWFAFIGKIVRVEKKDLPEISGRQQHIFTAAAVVSGVATVLLILMLFNANNAGPQ